MRHEHQAGGNLCLQISQGEEGVKKIEETIPGKDYNTLKPLPALKGRPGAGKESLITIRNPLSLPLPPRSFPYHRAHNAFLLQEDVPFCTDPCPAPQLGDGEQKPPSRRHRWVTPKTLIGSQGQFLSLLLLPEYFSFFFS